MSIFLIDCPACGNKISSQAIACPKCGQPIRPELQPEEDTKSDKVMQNNQQQESGHDIMTSTRLILCAIFVVVMVIFSLMDVNPLVRVAVGIGLCIIAFSRKKMIAQHGDSQEETNLVEAQKKSGEPLFDGAKYWGYGALTCMIIGFLLLPVIFSPLAVFFGGVAVSQRNKLGWWGIIGGIVEILYFIIGLL